MVKNNRQTNDYDFYPVIKESYLSTIWYYLVLNLCRISSPPIGLFSHLNGSLIS